MGKRKLGALEKVDFDLANLQYKVRGDPTSYKDEFIKQYAIYEASRDLFFESPASSTADGAGLFKDLIEFIAHVSDCYPDLTRNFPQDLRNIIVLHHAVLEAEIREKIVGSLVLLKKKGIIDSSAYMPHRLLQTLFPILTSTHSKSLRALLFQKILSDLRSSNSKTTDHRLNRTIQTVLYNLLTSDRTSAKGLWAVKLTRELWKRHIWTDAKAVEIMKEASLADNEKVIVGGVRFFLGGDKKREEMEEESSDDDGGVDLGALRHQAGINKKSKKKTKALETARAKVKKKERRKNHAHPLNFSALHLLHDPQGFAETLFSKHLQNSKSKLNLEQKLLVLQLVSRLVGLHKLTIISLYSYFLKYLTPRQPSVTSFLASLAQSTHDLVPPDILEPLVQKIANEFVSEAAASEIASTGLNAIREICVRQPLAMNDTLLQDLVMYRKSKDKGVMMAAKGLLSLYREVGADMLRKRDRGKAATMGIRAGKMVERRYGEEAAGGIEGLELLEDWFKEEKRRKRIEKGLPAEAEDGEDETEAEDGDADDWGAWDVQDAQDSDDSGGWINVESDAEIDISDSEDEKDKGKNKKAKMDATTTDPPASAAAGAVATSNPPGEEVRDSGPVKESVASFPQQISTLATSKILTPADLAKLADLRTQAQVSDLLAGGKHKKQHAAHHQLHHPSSASTSAAPGGLQASRGNVNPNEYPIDASQLTLSHKLTQRATRETKLAASAAGKPDRVGSTATGAAAAATPEQYRSKEATRQARKRESGKSSTNKEKARRKNFLMTLGKARGKNKRSLVEQRRVLTAHKERGKRGGRRGNKG
ncbi:MAG: Severe Depolymerization of Actin [Sclerophora amabilis]|nr:MAG: Severe Depolymerization of Actin [Sclerophora amabilis]